MGILTDICMILALIASFKQGAYAERIPGFLSRTLPQAYRLIAFVALWNVVWFAARNIDYFWGQMSLVSGISTLLILMPLIDVSRFPHFLQNSLLAHIIQRLATRMTGWNYVIVRLFLTACILQYSVTLIKLNLA
jgi:hypothetical protein